jgi:hypothetical protein
MREALCNGAHENGYAARLLVKQNMDPSSYEDFLALLERFPGWVIELGIYDIDLGMIPGRNTIFWEVRNT